MPKFLLDKFIKSKLDEYTVSYDQNAWKSLESKLDVGQSTGFWKSISIAPKVIGSVAATGLIGCVVYFAILKNDSESTTKINNSTSKSEITSKAVETISVVDNTTKTAESFTKTAVSTPKPNKINSKVTTTNVVVVTVPLSPIADDSETISSTSKAITNIVVDNITSELVVASEAYFTEGKQVQEPEVVEEKQKEEYVKPKPIPAKDVFNKKKRRGLFYFLGIRR